MELGMTLEMELEMTLEMELDMALSLQRGKVYWVIGGKGPVSPVANQGVSVTGLRPWSLVPETKMETKLVLVRIGKICVFTNVLPVRQKSAQTSRI